MPNRLRDFRTPAARVSRVAVLILAWTASQPLWACKYSVRGVTFVALADAQRLLGLEERINEIRAIDCLCLTADENPAEILRRELSRVLPEAKVVHLGALADARARQRRMSERTAAFTAAAVVAAVATGGVWVAVIDQINEKESK